MNRSLSPYITALIVFVASSFLLASSAYIVDQKKVAIVFAMGEIKRVEKEPGLHFKLPFGFQNVVLVDQRLHTITNSEADRFITSEKKNIVVESYVKWKVTEPRLYFERLSADESRAGNRLSQIVKAALNDEITKRTVKEVISNQREKLMQDLTAKVADDAKQVGLDVVDVRLLRVDYVEQTNASVYERMRSERAQVANELRSKGYAELERLKADADKQRVVIVANAYKEAEKIRGEGDAEASRIYATAFGKNPEFYRFYRSLEAYRASFKSKSDYLVVDTSSDFFKYFKSPGSGSASSASSAPSSTSSKK